MAEPVVEAEPVQSDGAQDDDDIAGCATREAAAAATTTIPPPWDEASHQASEWINTMSLHLSTLSRMDLQRWTELELKHSDLHWAHQRVEHCRQIGLDDEVECALQLRAALQTKVRVEMTHRLEQYWISVQHILHRSDGRAQDRPASSTMRAVRLKRYAEVLGVSGDDITRFDQGCSAIAKELSTAMEIVSCRGSVEEGHRAQAVHALLVDEGCFEVAAESRPACDESLHSMKHSLRVRAESLKARILRSVQGDPDQAARFLSQVSTRIVNAGALDAHTHRPLSRILLLLGQVETELSRLGVSDFGHRCQRLLQSAHDLSRMLADISVAVDVSTAQASAWQGGGYISGHISSTVAADLQDKSDGPLLNAAAAELGLVQGLDRRSRRCRCALAHHHFHLAKIDWRLQLEQLARPPPLASTKRVPRSSSSSEARALNTPPSPSSSSPPPKGPGEAAAVDDDDDDDVDNADIGRPLSKVSYDIGLVMSEWLSGRSRRT